MTRLLGRPRGLHQWLGQGLKAKKFYGVLRYHFLICVLYCTLIYTVDSTQRVVHTIEYRLHTTYFILRTAYSITLQHYICYTVHWAVYTLRTMLYSKLFDVRPRLALLPQAMLCAWPT